MSAIKRVTGPVLFALGAILSGSASGGTAQPANPPAAQNCSAPEYRQFDFWIGSWTVTEAGKPAGHNRIERVLNGCALSESWSGVSGTKGHSLSFYDRATGKWHQTWVDSGGGALYLDGAFADGVMTLEGTRKDPVTGKEARERIRWSLARDGTVRQLWDRASPVGGAWEPVFDGRYERHSAGDAPRHGT